MLLQLHNFSHTPLVPQMILDPQGLDNSSQDQDPQSTPIHVHDAVEGTVAVPGVEHVSPENSGQDQDPQSTQDHVHIAVKEVTAIPKIENISSITLIKIFVPLCHHCPLNYVVKMWLVPTYTPAYKSHHISKTLHFLN